jgi:hypothetical protein
MLMGQAAHADVVTMHGNAPPGRAHHHFFDGELAELLAYRAALSRRHVDELGGAYFARKFKLNWQLVWRKDGSLARADKAIDGADVPTLVELVMETGQNTLASLEELLARSWHAAGAEGICGHVRVFPRLSALAFQHSGDLRRLSLNLIGNLVLYLSVCICLYPSVFIRLSVSVCLYLFIWLSQCLYPLRRTRDISHIF